MMAQSLDIWKALAGVAIFLLGVRFLEESIQVLSGRKFKLFLKKQTSNKLKAIGGGAVVTAVLQSSSVVSLMVLAFVGAGVITMENALGVILGANLGTTLSNWIVALVGFNVSIESFALPMAGIAGIGYAIFDKQTKKYNWSRLLLGFSFMFLGLSYMKTGIEGLVVSFNLEQFKGSSILIFFSIGFIITALIQSSSATIAITLSALYAGAITLFDATAIVLGSEIGTTIKLFIASIKGTASKKRVALGIFMFNSISVTLALLFLSPLNRLVTDIVGIKDNLISLVLFQSVVNIFGIIVFYPFLNLFARFLERRFTKNDIETLYIEGVSPNETTTAILALRKEASHLFNATLDFSWNCFEKENMYRNEMMLHKDFLDHNLNEKYTYIKFLYGEIHSFQIQVQKHSTDGEDIEQLERMISSVRNTMYAAKSIKDAIPDIQQLRNSSNDTKYQFYQQTEGYSIEFCTKVYALLSEKKGSAEIDELVTLYKDITGRYTATLQQLQKESTVGFVSETEITTLLNFNREMFTFFKSMVFGLKDYLYSKEQSQYFEELPGFIR